MSIIKRHFIGDFMKASIVDLRYKTSEILKALERNEAVEVLYHGKLKGIIQPVGSELKVSIVNHPFFNMSKENDKTVLQELDALRAPRHVI